MNWAAMSAREIRSYAPLYAASPLERALVALVEEDAINRKEVEEIEDQAAEAESERDAAEAKFGELKDGLLDVLDNEEGDDAQLIKRIREILEDV